MIKEYIPDPKKVEEIYHGRRKKREKWKQRKPVRIALYLIFVLVVLLSVLFAYFNRDVFNIRSHDDLIGVIALMVIVESFFIGLPIIIYCKMSSTKTEVPPIYKNHETLILYEDRIINGFEPVKEGDYSKEMYMVNEIKYSDIKRLEYDEYLELFTVCGRVEQTVYDSRDKKNVYSKKTIERESLDFYLYYKNSDDFMKTVEERSGVMIEVIDRNIIN